MLARLDLSKGIAKNIAMGTYYKRKARRSLHHLSRQTRVYLDDIEKDGREVHHGDGQRL
jgi:hypothetical protein